MVKFLDINKKITLSCLTCNKKFTSYKSTHRKYCSIPCAGMRLQKGKTIQYEGLHTWIKRRLVKPKNCQNCNKLKSLDLANISQEYKRDLGDWEWLCRSCHMLKDGRIKRLHQFPKHFKPNPWGYKGISWYKPYQKWQVRVSQGRKHVKHIGYFNNLEEAIKVAKEAWKIYV